MEQGANNNITLVEEAVSTGGYTAELATAFSYDGTPLGENQFPPRGEPHELPARQCVHLQATEQGERCFPGCEQPGLGDIRRLSESFAMRSRTKQINENWLASEEEPSGDTVEHCYAGSKHVQNYDGSSCYGSTWQCTPLAEAGFRIAGCPMSHPPTIDPASEQLNRGSRIPGGERLGRDANLRPSENCAFSVVERGMSIRTWQSPTSAGDERNLYGLNPTRRNKFRLRGEPHELPARPCTRLQGVADRSSALPVAGSLLNASRRSSENRALRRDRARDDNLESRLDFDGTVAPTDLSRATDAREKGRIGIFGSQLSYAGSSGRVTSEPLGRDLNPLGRGDGGAYVAGAVNLGVIAPRLPGSRASGGTGNSVNNCGQCGGGASDVVLINEITSSTSDILNSEMPMYVVLLISNLLVPSAQYIILSSILNEMDSELHGTFLSISIGINWGTVLHYLRLTQDLWNHTGGPSPVIQYHCCTHVCTKVRRVVHKFDDGITWSRMVCYIREIVETLDDCGFGYTGCRRKESAVCPQKTPWDDDDVEYQYRAIGCVMTGGKCRPPEVLKNNCTCGDIMCNQGSHNCGWRAELLEIEMSCKSRWNKDTRFTSCTECQGKTCYA